MDPKYKTLIPLIIIFFALGIIIGIGIGYVAIKPVTIVKTVNVTVTPIPTPTPTSSPTPSPTLTPTPTPTSSPTPTASDFTVKDYYNPDTDIPDATVIFDRNFNVIPSTVSVHPGQSVLIRITVYTLPYRLTLILNNSYQKDLGTAGGAFVTFNKNGTYPFKAVIPSGNPSILPRPYAEGTIIVY
jgi:hypothetical protein